MNVFGSIKKIKTHDAGSTLLVVLVLSACTSSQYKITTDEDAWIQSASGQKTSIKKNEPIEIDSKAPFWIESAGRMPILAIPLASAGGTIETKFKSLETPDTWDAKVVEDRAMTVADEVLKSSHEVEIKISKRSYQDALNQTETLLKTYPSLSYLRWMKASTLVLLGKKQEALIWIGETLRLDPQNPAGRSLYEQLKRELDVKS